MEKYTRRNCWSCVWKRRHHAIAQGCGYVYPFPEGMDQNNMDHIASYLETAPLGAFFMVIVAHLGGAFLGGLGTSIFSKNINTAYIVGGFSPSSASSI